MLASGVKGKEQRRSPGIPLLPPHGRSAARRKKCMEGQPRLSSPSSGHRRVDGPMSDGNLRSQRDFRQPEHVAFRAPPSGLGILRFSDVLRESGLTLSTRSIGASDRSYNPGVFGLRPSTGVPFDVPEHRRHSQFRLGRSPGRTRRAAFRGSERRADRFDCRLRNVLSAESIQAGLPD